MPYFLKHYFDPYYDYLNPVPRVDVEGHADNFSLGYVHNVVKGQVLAELIPFEESDPPAGALADPNMVLSSPTLPVGYNTAVDPTNPLRLFSTLSGYVYYDLGCINTKRILNMRQGINFHTGNIAFVGDVAVHDVVQSGFELRAGGNVIVKELIEGAFIRATGGIVGEKGFKGSDIGRLISANDIRLSFAENGKIRANGKLIVDGSCLHCSLYCNDAVIRSRMHGGKACIKNILYVTHRLGNEGATPTEIIMGEDPALYRNVRKIGAEVQRLITLQEKYQSLIAKNEHLAAQYLPMLERIETKLKIASRIFAHYKLKADENTNFNRCRVIVPGTIMPGVRISIGEAVFWADQRYDNVSFYLEGDRVAMHSPAVANPG